MNKERIEDIPHFEVSFSPQESVQSARRALTKYSSNAVLVKDEKGVRGYVNSDTLLRANPRRLLADVSLIEIEYFPPLEYTELFQLMYEKDIPVVGIKESGKSIFFLERNGVYNYIIQRALKSFDLMEKSYPFLMIAFIDQAQKLICELEFIKQTNLSESGHKHHKTAFIAASRVITSIMFILDLYRMGLISTKMEDIDLMSTFKDISQRLSALYPEMIVEVDDSIRDRAPTICGDIFLMDMLLAIILSFTEDESIPGKRCIYISYYFEEDSHIIKFDGQQPMNISSLEMIIQNEEAPKNPQQDAPTSLFLRKVLERYHGSLRVIENDEGGHTILLKIPASNFQ
ncbi:MAG: hypothetical protein ACXACU_10575 [Candidatus Hodarchaeales archaeon]|jgi:hypothetical protein